MSDDLPRYRMEGDEHPVRRVINDQICVFKVFWIPFGILGLILTVLGVHPRRAQARARARMGRPYLGLS